MTLIERLRTMAKIWPRLKPCDALSLLTVKKSGALENMLTMTWEMDEREQVIYQLAHINSMVVRQQIDLKMATRLVSNELGSLITMQTKEKTAVDLEEMIREAGLILSEPPGRKD